MSKENVEIIRALIPPPEVDIVPLFREDALFEDTASALASIIDPQIEARAPWQGPAGRSYLGVNGFRQLWLDWLEPWVEYHTYVDDVIDAGDRVVVLIKDRGRREDSEVEVELRAGSVWKLREGRITRVEFFGSQEDALAATGVESGT